MEGIKKRRGVHRIMWECQPIWPVGVWIRTCAAVDIFSHTAHHSVSDITASFLLPVPSAASVRFIRGQTSELSCAVLGKICSSYWWWLELQLCVGSRATTSERHGSEVRLRKRGSKQKHMLQLLSILYVWESAGESTTASVKLFSPGEFNLGKESHQGQSLPFPY